MLDYRVWFAEWFNSFNPIDNEWLKNLELHTTVENSPWHREENVYVHTKMVVNEYFKLIGDRKWTYNDMLGGLALAFHDCGKPMSKEEIVKEDGSIRFRFGGHEQKSACLWRDYLTKFSKQFSLLPTDVESLFYPVAWLIENHLPYDLKHKDKVNNLVITLHKLGIRDVFFNVLLADARGRISDDHDIKIQKVKEWINQFPNTADTPNITSKRNVIFLIGCSGSGKTTYVANECSDANIFSYDQLRLRWYSDQCSIDIKEQYQQCFKKSTEDTKFNDKAMKEFHHLIKHNHNDIVIDNMNLSVKSRKALIVAAKHHGLTIKAVIFVVSKDELNKRQHSRQDKFLNEKIINQQFFSMSVPSYGDVDVITVLR